MVDSLDLPSLHVEGETDRHTIRHLLARHDIELDQNCGPVLIKTAQNDRGVLDAMTTAARASTTARWGSSSTPTAQSRIAGRQLATA